MDNNNKKTVDTDFSIIMEEAERDVITNFLIDVIKNAGNLADIHGKENFMKKIKGNKAM